MAKRIRIRQWRMVVPTDGEGLFLWFDPSREFPRLYDLEPQMKSGVEDYAREGDLNGSGDEGQVRNEVGRQPELPF